MAGALQLIDYDSDSGETVCWPQDTSNSTAAGNIHATQTNKPDRGMRPRYVLAQHPTTGRQRKIVIGNVGNPLWTGTGAGADVITLPDFQNLMAPTVFKIQGRMGERRFAQKAH